MTFLNLNREGNRTKNPSYGENVKIDQNQEATKKLARTIEPLTERYFGGEFSVDMIAVHPMYWRRGHGTSLLTWAAEQADEDRIPLGVAAAPMGMAIARYVGFLEQDVVNVEVFEQHPESLSVWIGVRPSHQIA